MKIRALLSVPVAVGVAMAVTIALTAPAQAANHSVRPGDRGSALSPAAGSPRVTNIRTSVALGATVGLDGSFKQQLTARSAGPTVGWAVTYLPECGADPLALRFPGGTTFRRTFRQATVGDLCSGDGFALAPLGASGGSAGARHAVGTDWPEVVDDDVFVLHGAWTHGCSSPSYGGCFVRAHALGARASVSTDVSDSGPSYSTGIVGQTGPGGGVAAVYVDGVRRGRVDFSSRTVVSRSVVFVFGSADFSSVRPAPTHTISLVLIGPGTFGGTAMTLDAVALDPCCGD